MSTLTQTMIDNAVSDMSGIEKFVNDAAASSPFTTRLGRQAKNMAALEAEVIDLATGSARYNYDGSTTMADPSTGGIRFNNASLASVTAIAVSALSAGAGNPDISALIAAFGSANNAAGRGTLVVRDVDATAIFAVFNITGPVTDNGTWLTFPVAYVAGNGGPSSADVLSLQWSRSGSDGVSTGPRYVFATSTSMTEPAICTFRLNNAAIDSATEMAISVITADSGGPNRLAWLNTFDDSTTLANRGTLTITSLFAPENFAVYRINDASVDNTTWVLLALEYIEHNGSFAADDILVISFVPTGAAGAGVGDMQAANNLSDVANVATARANLGIVGIPRETLAADRTYYVRADGSDANNGLADTSGGAWLTIQHAVTWVRDNLDFGGHRVTIQVGAGTYTGLFLADGIPFTGGICYLKGDTTTPSNVVINAPYAGNSGIQVTYPCHLEVGGFKIAHATNLTYGIYVSGGAEVNIIGKMEFGAVAVAHIVCPANGTIVVAADYTISGNSVAHLYSYHAGFIEFAGGQTVTLTGTPAFTNFVLCVTGGQVAAPSVTFSGSATGTRYSASSGGGIDSAGGGASYFPGNSAGSATSPGWYN